MTVAPAAPPVSGGPVHRLSAWLSTRPKARLLLLLAAPVLWLGVIYFASLFALLSTAFFSVDEFTNAVIRSFTLSNFADLAEPAYARATLRTVGIATSVTLLCLLIGFPMAYYMARVAKPRSRPFLVALVVTPLWAAYLVKVYAWQAMVQPETGVIAWGLAPFGLDGPGYGVTAVILTLTYLWLPYMILPIYAGLERLPGSYLDASADLGGRPLRTFRSVILPMIVPSIIAGTIFTFSLSLGDYITVTIVGGTTQMLGNIVYQNYTANLPFAAAVATIPVAIMVIYLLVVRRTGALESL